MLIPLLHIIAIFTPFSSIRFWRRSTQLPTQMQVARYIALPFMWNAAIAYILLVTLPSAFGVKMSVILLFQPEVGWVAVISGIFVIVWGLFRTGIVISTLRQVWTVVCPWQKENQRCKRHFAHNIMVIPTSSPARASNMARHVTYPFLSFPLSKMENLNSTDPSRLDTYLGRRSHPAHLLGLR